ncbi:hypothetical protein GGR52DRAFT_568114 [Hypoxylon sp. FL1284]|nr:hypothetical protein GGR52DRAFT_568114 [Hypoxylon sp. FL1284]
MACMEKPMMMKNDEEAMDYYNQVEGFLDSGVDMTFNDSVHRAFSERASGRDTEPVVESVVETPTDNVAATMEATTDRAEYMTMSLEHNGAIITYTLEQLEDMAAQLTNARAQGLFPPTKAVPLDPKVTVPDYLGLLALNQARCAVPRQEWTKNPTIVDLLVRITREIRARDKAAAEKTETERVKAHVDTMMSGLGAEARLYAIVEHAVNFAIKKGSDDEAAALTGKNMAQVLLGIEGVVKDMAGKGTHGVTNLNVESILEEVFGTIDFALDGKVKHLDGQIQHVDGQIQHVDGQIQHVDGQIQHLNAIGHHVNAIDGHVSSLGNNINSFGTLLNSTNGNVVALTTQIGLLQTIVNVLPRLVEDNLQQMAPRIIQEAFGPILQAIEVYLNSTSPGGFSFTNPPAYTEVSRKSKTKGFFKKISSGVKKLFGNAS